MNNWLFLRPYCFINSIVLPSITLWFLNTVIKSLDNINFESHLGKHSVSLANIALSWSPVLTNVLPTVWIISRARAESYWQLIFNNISANPIIPRPICLQSFTVNICSSNGCNFNPSSNTLFKALIAILTALLNSGILNAACGVNGFSTNSLKFNAPNKQLPPAGNGSSAQGLTPAYSKFSKLFKRL